jgi:hypothetical protein
MFIDCDLNMQLADLSDVCGKLKSLSTSLKGGGDKIELNDNF